MHNRLISKQILFPNKIKAKIYPLKNPFISSTIIEVQKTPNPEKAPLPKFSISLSSLKSQEK